MSGPKVVRIVTRDEVLAVCRGQLARVDAAIAHWLETANRCGGASAQEIAATNARRNALEALIEADRFLELQKQADAEIAFLQSDEETRLVRESRRVAAEAVSRKRRADAGSALLSALQAAGKEIDDKLKGDLEGVGAGNADDGALSRGFALLSEPASSAAASQRLLADSLKESSAAPRLEDWIETHTPQQRGGAIERIEGKLAEMSLATGEPVDTSLRERLQRAISEPSENRRDLLLDSLEMDASRLVLERRQLAKAARALDLAFTELGQINSATVTRLSLKRDAARSASDFSELLREVTLAIASERDGQAAAARRAAVLKGLAGLGYEVTEGVSTAWVEQGKVVLRQAARPNYGVELSGDLATARLQLRAVAFTGADGHGPDPSRDTDAETIWCGDVTSLQQTLAKAGGGLSIERALAIGAVPLKRVVDATYVERQQAREGPSNSGVRQV